MTNPFENLRAKAGDGQKSIWWYMRNAQKLVGASLTPTTAMQSEFGELKSNIEIGSMYMYYYDPKWKNELPFYDAFPLVLPFGPAPGGFYGINLHYAPYLVRGKILGELLKFADSKTFTPTTKIRMSYQMLQGISSAKEVKPCIKHYLTTHVQSRFMKINPSDWKSAIFLPLEAFQKKTKEEVFRDSRSKY